MNAYKYILLSLVAISFSITMKGQCTPDPTCTGPANEVVVCPNVIPDLYENTPYYQVVTFSFPTSVAGINIHHLSNMGATNPPPGISYNIASTNLYPNQQNCIEVLGTPPNGSAGTYTISVYADVFIVGPFGIAIPIGTISDSSMQITIFPTQTTNISFNLQDEACENETVTIEYTGDTLPNASFIWNLDGGTVLSGNYPTGTFDVSWLNPGTKHIQLSVTNGSDVYTDSSAITIYQNPTIDLGPDLPLIPGDSVLLNAGNFTNYFWSTGDTSSQIYVFQENTFTVFVTDSNGCAGNDNIFVYEIGETQNIPLPSGWSIFSTFINPFEPLLDSILSDIIQDVTIVKDENGDVYWPNFNINFIGNNTIGEAYQIKTKNPTQISVYGSKLTPEIYPIHLPSGWSFLGYIRDNQMSVSIALQSISQHINLVKNGTGDIYWPIYGINNIGNMIPGEGYQIKMNTTKVYFYPAN